MFGHSRAAFRFIHPNPIQGRLRLEPTWGRRRSGAWGGQRRRRCTSQKHDRSGWCFSDTMFGSEALQAPSNEPETLSVAATSACLDTVGLPSLIHPYPIQGRLRQNPPGVGAGVGLGVGKGVGAAHDKKRCLGCQHCSSNEPEWLSVAMARALLERTGLPSLLHPNPIQGRLRWNPPGVGAGVGLGVGKGVGAAHHKSTTGQDGVSQTPCLA